MAELSPEELAKLPRCWHCRTRLNEGTRWCPKCKVFRIPKGGTRKGLPYNTGNSQREQAELSKFTARERIEIKSMIKSVLDGTMPDLKAYIQETAVADPGKAAELIIRLAEFEVPKLGRLDVKVDQISDAELLLELERRERDLLAAKVGGQQALPEHVEAEFTVVKEQS